MNGHLKQIVTSFVLITELDSLMNSFLENECVVFLFKSIIRTHRIFGISSDFSKSMSIFCIFRKMGDYRRVTMGINFKLQKRNLRDLAWNHFVWGREKWNRKMYLESC